MISSMSGQEVRGSLAEAVHRQTEGNPLFVQEVLRYFIEQGFVKREGDHWTGEWRSGSGELPESAIPEGLRDVIGKRLSGLSESSNRVLAVAAVIGRDFTLDVVERVVDATADEIVAALEEARAAGIVEERAATGGNVA
jgi:predicted ATPase